MRGEEGEQPALDAVRDARARRGRAVAEANVERVAEEALVQVERGGGDAAVADGETQLLLEPLQALKQLAPTRRRAEVRIRSFLVVRVMENGDTLLFASGRYVDRIALPEMRYEERVVICDSRRFDTLLAIPL